MEFELDKEIDFLLRQTARGGDVVSNVAGAHLDPDEITAFAENALPEKTRQTYMRHLADCDRCRKSLSDLIQLNSKFETEFIHSHAEEKTLVAVPEIPWYRKLFAFPGLAYAMGALVLVFSGIAVFTILQNTSNTSFDMSQVSEKQPNGKGMSDSGAEPTGETFSANRAMNSSVAASNTTAANTMMSNAASMNSSTIPSAPSALTANSNLAVSRDKDLGDVKTSATPELPSPAKEDLVKKTETSPAAGAVPPPAPPPAPPTSDDNFVTDSQISNQAQQESIMQNQSQITPDSRSVKRQQVPAMRAENKSRKLEQSREDELEKSKSAATTTVGGKTFRRAENVWYDTAYRGQATKNITRGTNEYKKLDSGLRGIIENLGGTVVVVWKQKTYRIQ